MPNAPWIQLTKDAASSLFGLNPTFPVRHMCHIEHPPIPIIYQHSDDDGLHKWNFDVSLQ